MAVVCAYDEVVVAYMLDDPGEVVVVLAGDIYPIIAKNVLGKFLPGHFVSASGFTHNPGKPLGAGFDEAPPKSWEYSWDLAHHDRVARLDRRHAKLRERKRSFYHGWKYRPDGQCIEQPAEPQPFCDRIRIRSYPTQEYLGLIFAYLGEGNPPPLRRYPDHEQPGVLVAGPPEYWPCNFFNRLDNATDGAHVPWTHRESLRRVAAAAGEDPYSPGPTERITEETEYGLRSGVVQSGRTVFQTHFHMPITNQTVSARRVEGSMEDAVNLTPHRLFWRLPVDDEHCVSFVVDWIDLQGEQAQSYLERRRRAEVTQDAPLHQLSRDVLSGEICIHDVDCSLSTYKLFWVEDYVAQCGQGPVADRSHEHLGRSDVGVSALRALWARELKALAEGRPLKQWRTPAGLINRSSAAARRAAP